MHRAWHLAPRRRQAQPLATARHSLGSRCPRGSLRLDPVTIDYETDRWDITRAGLGGRNAGDSRRSMTLYSARPARASRVKWPPPEPYFDDGPRTACPLRPGLACGGSQRVLHEETGGRRRADRHARRRAPIRRADSTFDAWIEPVNDGGWHRLWLRLTSRQGLSAVQLAVTEGEGVEFTTGQYGVEPGSQPPVLRATKSGEAGAEGMAPDERTAWAVQFSQSRPPEIRLKITAVQKESTWDVTVPVKTPREPNVW